SADAAHAVRRAGHDLSRGIEQWAAAQILHAHQGRPCRPGRAEGRLDRIHRVGRQGPGRRKARQSRRRSDMTRLEFLDTLRRRLAGLPPSEIDELISDYAAHFADGMAAGRSEAEIAAALGDPMRLARELRAEAGFRRWETARTPANFFAVLFGFLALIAVDFVFLLPLLGGLALFVFIAAIVAFAL